MPRNSGWRALEVIPDEVFFRHRSISFQATHSWEKVPPPLLA